MDLWEQVLDRLHVDTDPEEFDTWLSPTRLIDIQEFCCRVSVPNQIFVDCLERSFAERIQSTLVSLRPGPWEVEFSVRGTDGPSIQPNEERIKTENTPARATTSAATYLNPRYTFDNFIVGSCNQFAHAAAVAVAELPSSTYNPLFIYGGVGLGKTHLMHAIGNLAAHGNGLRQCYLSSEAFVNELIQAIRYDRTSDFRDKYRKTDILLIDDIQFLAGKERTQEEFFHTFNALYESGKQIVITSDRPPREIPTIEERLCSRFEMGLLADLQAPDLETKVAILRKKAAAEGIGVPDDVAIFIATNIRSNIRELEGALIRLGAYASITNAPIDMAMARSVLDNILFKEDKKVSVDDIQRFVANYFNLRPAELKARDNSQHIVFPRQIAMYLCKSLTPCSLPEIGRRFGKHHSTVLHAIRKIEGLRRDQPDLDKLINTFIDSL